MEHFVIYEKPRDYPNHWCVRRYTIGPNMGVKAHEVSIFIDLEEARAFLRRTGLHCVPRHKDDDSVIIETWL